MKPVAIFRHARTEGPGYFADFLDARGIPRRLICVDAGDTIPTDVQQFSGLVFMGGPMSVNDGLPWIPPVLALIRGAIANDIPVLGHCLGGQLISKALGAVVGRNPVKEIGWGETVVGDVAEAVHWFGGTRKFLGFHWHGETFAIPKGATRLLSSAFCENQAFSLGKHLSLQCHIEMTTDMVREWCRSGADEISRSGGSLGVQPTDEIQRDLDQRVVALNVVAERVYTIWVEGLVL